MQQEGGSSSWEMFRTIHFELTEKNYLERKNKQKQMDCGGNTGGGATKAESDERESNIQIAW